MPAFVTKVSGPTRASTAGMAASTARGGSQLRTCPLDRAATPFHVHHEVEQGVCAMAGRNLRDARRSAIRNTQQAVRAFARDPSADTEQAVARACARLRMLEEWRARQLDDGRRG
jgi:hypothetical protein